MHRPLFIRKLMERVPQVTDYVWWAPKQIEGVVTQVGAYGFRFQAGPLVESKKGKWMPEWTVTANFDAGYYDDSLHAWIVGQGPVPKKIKGTLITPEPVLLKVIGE